MKRPLVDVCQYVNLMKFGANEYKNATNKLYKSLSKISFDKMKDENNPTKPKKIQNNKMVYSSDMPKDCERLDSIKGCELG